MLPANGPFNAMTEQTEHTDAAGGIPAGIAKHKVSNQLRGEAMAFAAQSAVYTLVANTFEPYISYRVQRHYAMRDPKHIEKHGNYSQNLAGELIGDLTGAATLVGLEALCPGPLHYCTRQFRQAIDPLYDSVARWVFKDKKNEPDYQKTVDEWKLYQERNLARSLVVSICGVACNIAAQKYLVGNPSPVKLILLGKAASTAVSTSIGLVARMVFSKQTQAIDRYMAKKIFTPIMNNGLTPEEIKAQEKAHAIAEQKAMSHTDRVTREAGAEEALAR